MMGLALLAGMLVPLMAWGRKKPEPEDDDRHFSLAPLPKIPTIFSGDNTPVTSDDLRAVAILLQLRAQMWLDEAMAEVIAQVAARDAAAGVDAVEDAANGGAA